MLTLQEWLQLVGLKARNPFANKQADHEREWLESVFVEHPAFDAIAGEAEPHSSILHAERGAGKTTTCTMFERLCHEEAAYRRPLVVRFDEWVPLVGLVDRPLADQVDGYLTALFEQTVYALYGICNAPWLVRPAEPSLRYYLAWFCLQYGRLLTDDELGRLTRTSQLLRAGDDQAAREPLRLTGQTRLRQLHWLVRALRAANLKTVYVLVDRVDEVAITVANPNRGADLLLPLLGNLELMELDGLVIKCFIPTEIVAALRARRQLREDRIPCYDLSWHHAGAVPLLRRLLQNRLAHFSEGAVQSLAALSDSRLRDIDDVVSSAAGGSPRRLLVLGELLLLARAADATSEDLLIQQRHVDAVIGRAGQAAAPAVAAVSAPDGKLPPPAAAGEERARPAEPPAPPLRPPAPSRVPPLTLRSDGCVSRGGVPIEGWQRLPTRQRDVLSYLFGRPDTLCHYSELGREIWRDSRISDDTVRKVVDRLSEFLHRGLDERPVPPYIEKVTGGRYVLRHVAAVDGQADHAENDAQV